MSKSVEEEPYKWSIFLEECEKLLTYMIENFESMIDGQFVKHLSVRCEGVSDLGSREVTEEHGPEIQEKVTPWLRDQFEKGYLTEKTNWSPFRDRCCFTSMYAGYRRLFQFEKYYFQLLLDKGCEIDLEDCRYSLNNENGTCFQLLLYGWKENENDIFIQPYGDVYILPDNIMSSSTWYTI